MASKYLIFGLLALPMVAAAQSQTFKDVAQNALISHPEIQARSHAWQAARDERSAAAGGFLPKLDLSASGGRENRDSPLLRDTYNQNQTTLTLTQMLYDGFATRNEVARLDHAALVRFFELQDVSETIALEVMRAYIDVARFRELVSLAEENYVRHRVVFDLIQSKVQAKVGRGVDLETSSGRLALAESNLVTEISNLHDVTARYTRLTGKTPERDLGKLPVLADKMPVSARDALANAIERNPSLWAAVQSLRSARSAAKTREAAYQPRFDLQLRSAKGYNIGNTFGSDTTHSANVVMTWNLYNGGSDIARVRQFAEQMNAAEDLIEKTCRDVRQTLAIAFNDTYKLRDQLQYLDQHQLSTEKARDAYRKQFDIGQRSLLDLLDTENELFQARRAYANANHDLMIAYGRVAGAMGQLIPALELTPQTPVTAADAAIGDDKDLLLSRCPSDLSAGVAIDKAALEKRVQQLAKESAATMAAPPQNSVTPPPANPPAATSPAAATAPRKKKSEK